MTCTHNARTYIVGPLTCTKSGRGLADLTWNCCTVQHVAAHGGDNAVTLHCTHSLQHAYNARGARLASCRGLRQPLPKPDAGGQHDQFQSTSRTRLQALQGTRTQSSPLQELQSTSHVELT